MPSTARHRLRCGPGGSRYTATARLSRLYMADSGHRNEPSGLYMAFRHGHPGYARWNSSAHTRGFLVEVPYIRHLANSSRWNLPYIGEVAPSVPVRGAIRLPTPNTPTRATPPNSPSKQTKRGPCGWFNPHGPRLTIAVDRTYNAGRSASGSQIRRSSASEWSATW